MRVKKIRRLCKLAYQGGVIAPAEAKARPEAGCGFELSCALLLCLGIGFSSGCEDTPETTSTSGGTGAVRGDE
jgi:hypothetical protein